MKNCYQLFLVLLAGCFLMVTGANAAAVTWTVNGSFDSTVRGGGGGGGVASGTAAGTFDYDADTNTYTNISITTTNFAQDGANFGGTFTSLFAFGTSDASHLFAEASSNIGGNVLVLQLYFEAALTNAGGVVLMDTNGNSLEVAPSWDLARVFASGAKVSTVPVPAAVWLFASGLGLLGWLRRKPV
jgi:hypothetical protein